MRRVQARYFTSVLWAAAFALGMVPWRAQARPTPLDLPSDGPDMLWRVHLPRPAGVGGALAEHFGIPAISLRQKRLVVGTRAGTISAFDVDHGTLAWSHHEGIPCDTPAIAVDRPDGSSWALLANWRGEYLAVDIASGKIIWRTPLEGIVRALPVVAENQIVCTTDDNKVFVLELLSGDIIWTQGRQSLSTGLTLDGHGRPLIVKDQVIVGYSGGHLASCRLRDGERAWSRTLGHSAQQAFLDADADPVFFQGRLYAASLRGGLFALDASSGATIWQQPRFDLTSLIVFDGRLWAAQADGKISWFDPVSGNAVGHGDLGASPLTQPLLIEQKLMMAAGRQGLVIWGPNKSYPESVQPLGAARLNALAYAPGYLAAVTGSGWLNVWHLPFYAAGQ